MARPLYTNELRTGHVVPLDDAGNPAPVDLSKPQEYEVSDPEVAELAGIDGQPLKFTVMFKKAGVPVDLICWVDADLGEGMVRVKCFSTYTAEEAPPPPPPPASHGVLIIDE